MKQFILLSLLFNQTLLFSQVAKETKTETKTSEVAPAKSETKTTAKEATSQPAIPKKELPPLQKDGGFYVLNGLKWQADNVQKKSYILAKEECEKNGMRLPHREELVDAYFSKYLEFRNPGGYYLSGTRVASNRSMLWYVNFDNGHHNHGTLTREYYYRCVMKQEDKSAEKKPAEEKK